MTTRIILLSFFTFLFAFLCLINFLAWYDGSNWYYLVTVLVFFGATVFIVWRSVLNDPRFKLVDDQVVIKHPLKNPFVIDLRQLTQWKETSYNIRGQRKRKLILSIDREKEIGLKNDTYKAEFEELYNHLNSKYTNLET